MIQNPFVPGFYSDSNRLLVTVAAREHAAIGERWQDEASKAALAGNPAKAAYIEFMIARMGT
jgi:hypothetical protein